MPTPQQQQNIDVILKWADARAKDPNSNLLPTFGMTKPIDDDKFETLTSIPASHRLWTKYINGFVTVSPINAAAMAGEIRHILNAQATPSAQPIQNQPWTAEQEQYWTDYLDWLRTGCYPSKTLIASKQPYEVIPGMTSKIHNQLVMDARKTMAASGRKINPEIAEHHENWRRQLNPAQTQQSWAPKLPGQKPIYGKTLPEPEPLLPALEIETIFNYDVRKRIDTTKFKY